VRHSKVDKFESQSSSDSFFVHILSLSRQSRRRQYYELRGNTRKARQNWGSAGYSNMSQSPLQRSSRRSLTAFAHPPSRLSKATSSNDLASSSRRQSKIVEDDPSDEEGEGDEAEPPAEVRSAPKPRTSIARPRPSTSSGAYATPPPAPRLRYEEDPTPRRTPIYYSPQATSTPPAGLSKSASIPFDMAASAKAARVAKVSPVTRDVGSGGGVGGGRSTKKARYVRKKSIFQR
jgi:hypothetical protein